MPIFIRSPYNYDAKAASIDSSLKCLDPSRTIQEQKDEADINNIVRRFGLTGELPKNIRIPQYGDFTGITSYQDALNQVIAADEAFMKLPAEIRAKFQNDPEQFVEFCLDEKNRSQLAEMGLLSKKEAQTEGGVSPTEGSAKKGNSDKSADTKKVESEH